MREIYWVSLFDKEWYLSSLDKKSTTQVLVSFDTNFFFLSKSVYTKVHQNINFGKIKIKLITLNTCQ